MNTVIPFIQKLYLRELDLLKQDVALYPSDAALWATTKGINNPAGNLCLHLCGNLQHFIGTVLGNTGYVRNREAEFADRDIPKANLLQSIEATKAAITLTLEKLDPVRLADPYPSPPGNIPMNVHELLIYLAAHLSYHRGQINYHRRIIAGEQ